MGGGRRYLIPNRAKQVGGCGVGLVRQILGRQLLGGRERGGIALGVPDPIPVGRLLLRHLCLHLRTDQTNMGRREEEEVEGEKESERRK